MYSVAKSVDFLNAICNAIGLVLAVSGWVLKSNRVVQMLRQNLDVFIHWVYFIFSTHTLVPAHSRTHSFAKHTSLDLFVYKSLTHLTTSYNTCKCLCILSC